MTQELQRAVESARSSLATASEKHVDTASKKLESLVSQVKEEWTAHAAEAHQQCLTDQERLRTVHKEERDEMTQELQRAVEKAHSSLATANQEHVDAASKKMESLMSQMKEEWTAHSIKEHQHRLTDQDPQPVCINVHILQMCMRLEVHL